MPDEIPDEFRRTGGVFVSIHREGALRGCIGTTEGTAPTLAAEIISNAISAATRDPRFEPVDPSELDTLDYSVDVLMPSEPVDSLADLDPKSTGWSAKKAGGGPPPAGLPGVDTVEEQAFHPKQKAGTRIEERTCGYIDSR